VRENTDFVISIVKKFVRNPEIIKDLTQEIFIKAYLSYEYYTETGKIRAWLTVIARNKLKDYYKSERNRIEQVSLEDYIISHELSPENIAEQNDFQECIVRIINSLPKKQREAVFYSVIYNYSEKEIAAMQDVPVGSVKSAKHYGLEKVRKIILDSNIVGADDPVRPQTPAAAAASPFKMGQRRIRKENNMSKLNKQEAYALLYQYAMNKITSEDKSAVEAYIKTDEEAANIAEALRELHGNLTYARDDEMTHYNIFVNLESGDRLLFSNISYHMENHKEMNEYLEKYDGYTPPDGHWFESGSDSNPADAVFDNNGNRVEMNTWYPEEGVNHHRQNAKKMKKIFYPVHWKYMFYHDKNRAIDMLGNYEKLDIAPNLYKAHIMNHFGGDIKSALYLALPENAVNIRMKRGNGVLECGKYKFLYVDRYVAADEGIHAECTFNLVE